MNRPPLTGLKVGDKVIEVFRQYTTARYKVGIVENLTATRVRVRFGKRMDETHTMQYSLKNGEQYPRSDSYSYAHIEEYTEENQALYAAWVERRRLESRALRAVEAIEKGRNLISLVEKVTLDQAKALVESLEVTAKLVEEIKT